MRPAAPPSNRLLAMGCLVLLVASNLPADEPPAGSSAGGAAPAPADGAAPAAAAPADPEEVARAKRAELTTQALKWLEERFTERFLPDPNVQPEILRQQLLVDFTQQFHPVVTIELKFIDRVCQPTPEERKAVKAAGDAAMLAVVKDYVELQVKLQQRRYRGHDRITWPNPRLRIHEAMAEATQKLLGADKAARYRAELDARKELRRKVVEHSTVAQLDRALLLSRDQRQKLLEVVQAAWNDEWYQRLEVLQHGPHYLPQLPEEKIVPLLSAAQKAVWDKMDKRRANLWGWTGYGMFQPPPDDEPFPFESLEGSNPIPGGGETAPASKP